MATPPPTGLTDVEKIMRTGIAVAKATPRQPPAEFALHLKRLNNRLLDFFVGAENAHAVAYDKELPGLYANFVWLQACCADATEIADMYNECHVAGVVFCKHVFAAGHAESGAPWAALTASDLFPAVPELHVASAPVSSLGIHDAMLLVSSLQHYWDRVVADPRTITALALLCFGVGRMLVFNMPASKEDSRDHVEDVTQREQYVRLKKKTTRTFLCTVLVMLRGLAIQHACVFVSPMSLQQEERDSCLRVQGYTPAARRALCLSDGLHSGVCRVKALREGAQQHGDQRTMDGESLWKYVASRMPEDALGLPPRKIDRELQTLLRNACVFQDASPAYFRDCVVLDECVHCLQAALMFFYVAPSVETYKKLRLVTDVRPGQRLTYCFDYMHFDTGQISQIVYLHNPMYKQSMPPKSINDWLEDSVCGPIAAFMQLDPTLQIWYDDAEDPLGLLGHPSQILRPADHNTTAAGGTAGACPRFAFILNRAGLYLVDRESARVFGSCPRGKTGGYHHVLYLLCLYVHLQNATQEVCKVAINSYKVFRNDHGGGV